MNQISYAIVILTFKLILIIGFVLSMRYWLQKKNNLAPIFTYWLLGLFFIFMMLFQIAKWFLMQFYYVENDLIRDADSIDSISAIIGLTIYFLIGIKYFKRKKNI